MDLRILLSMLSVMCSGVLHTVISAPAASSTVTPEHHVRTKRCSCATFLDKECVYFCHLDIIWVNTPERIVSYGLGSAPRKRRAALGSLVTKVTKKDPPRCKCVRGNDNTCANFCQMENRLRYNTSTDEVILSAQGDGCAEMQCKHTLASKTSRIKRVNSNDKRATSAVALRAALKTRLLLEKWRVRQHHRAKAWEVESTAS